MAVSVLLFLLGLVFLIKGGDWFVEAATGVAQRLRVPELLIGATVVSIGTTLPEVMVSATSALAGHGELAYGNAIGSIICNASLIAALTAAVRPSSVDRETLKPPVLFFFSAAVFYVLVAWTVGFFSRAAGAALLCLFLNYMAFTVRQARAGMPGQPRTGLSVEAPPLGRDVLGLVLGAALISLGAKLLVDNGTLIAQALGVAESVVALTFVALGTSLPELVTAISSLIKGHGALTLGNIIGANLFNLVLVGGVSATLAPFSIPAGKTAAGLNASLVVDLPLMLASMLLLTVPPLLSGKLFRWQGVILLSLYAAFCAFQFLT